jgi:peptidoglycan-associated lipoprotein
LLVNVVAGAQEFPRAEVGANYSYGRFIPSRDSRTPYSLNGGGGSLVVNINEFLGIKMDLQGYKSTTREFVIPASVNFPSGAQGSVSGDLFTYLFGPEIKVRAHKLQPFAHILFGAAHSNVYADAYKTICQPIVGGCAFRGSPASDAFAMAVGGGLDIPINHVISFRPAEADYLLTHFTNQFANNVQNNFRYSAGVLFSFGHTTY